MKPAPVDIAAVFRGRLAALLKAARRLPSDTVLVHRPGQEEEAAALRDWMMEDGLRVMQTANPARWPADLPLPLTVGDAMAAVLADETDLVKGLAGEVERCVCELVAPEYRDRVLARLDVVERWPWPEPGDHIGPAGTALHALWRAFLPRSWPGEAAPLVVARWAAPRLRCLGPLHARVGADFVAMAKRGRVDAGLTSARAGLTSARVGLTSARVGLGARYPAAGLALLCLAESACRLVTPARPSMFPVAVDRPPVRALVSLGGADPRDLDGDAKLTEKVDPSAPLELTFRWPDRTQLVIPWLPAGAGALVAVSNRYGPAAVRDMLALYLFTWTARAAANVPVWWWPDEHLELARLADTPDARARLRAMWADLHGTTLIARYPIGAPLIGPLVARLNTDGTAQELRIHPALYRGVTGEDGTPGRRFWLVPLELLQLPAGGEHGRVHVLAPVLGHLWRATLRSSRRVAVARIGVARLAAYLNVHKRGDRNADRRVGDVLRATLEAGVACGLVGTWSVERGDLDSLAGIVVVTPGAAALAACEGADIERPAWLPATGSELERWMADVGLTSVRAGELLTVPAATVRRMCSTYRGRPLPPRVRAALRRLLWPDPRGCP